MSQPREFDIVVWGATGFTGRLVAAYLLKQYKQGELKWAMGGRNPAKLDSIKKALAAEHIPTILADSMNSQTLDALTRRTHVVCSTVGPYAKYGSDLVASCVKNKTDYCDLTGEVQWMRKMIDAHQEQAATSGTRIVHTCGFDSIPSDMGVYFLQQQAIKRTGTYCEKIKLRVKAMKGGLSGGTYASLNNVLKEAERDKSIRKILMDPYGLNPTGVRSGLDGPDLQSVRYDSDAGSWITPFIMSSINTRVVRRSHALSGFPYGDKFQYDEALMTGPGISGRAKAIATLVGTGIVASSKQQSLTRRTLNRIFPKPGEGPTDKQRRQGYFKLTLFGLQSNGEKITASVSGDRDPGYGSTSKMLAESAVCLAKDKEISPQSSGILTPSTAMGDALLQRLSKNAGLTFTLEG